MRKIVALLVLLLATAGCYPRFQLRVFTEVGEDGGVSRVLTYSGDPYPPLKLPDGPQWKLEQKETFFKITRFYPNPAELKTDISFPTSYPDEATFSDSDRALLAELRLKKFSPETFFFKNDVTISKKNWVFFTVYRYSETFENRKVVEMLREVEGIDTIAFAITGKNKELEQILSNFQFVYELKMPGNLIKSSSKDLRTNYCSWNFTMAEFWWGYREYRLKATSIKTNYTAIVVFALVVFLLIFGLFYFRTGRWKRFLRSS